MKREQKKAPEVHDGPPIPDVQIIDEKSSSSTLLSSMGFSSASKKNSTSYERIRELEDRIVTQEADAKEANDRYKKLETSKISSY